MQSRVSARVNSRAILRGHHTLTPVARQALKLIARYPLLAARDLAALLGVSRNKLVAPLRALQMLELICDHDGLLVLPSGLGLLAGWLRISARALARYSPWRLRRIGSGYAESVQGLLRLRDHNRRVAQFAAGLREQGVSLQGWDNPLDGEGPTQLLSPTRHGHVIPDAIGALRVAVAAPELAHERELGACAAIVRIEPDRALVSLCGEPAVHVAEIFSGDGILRICKYRLFELAAGTVQPTLRGKQHSEVVVRLGQIRVLLTEHREGVDSFGGSTEIGEQNPAHELRVNVARLRLQESLDDHQGVGSLPATRESSCFGQLGRGIVGGSAWDDELGIERRRLAERSGRDGAQSQAPCKSENRFGLDAILAGIEVIRQELEF